MRALLAALVLGWLAVGAGAQTIPSQQGADHQNAQHAQEPQAEPREARPPDRAPLAAPHKQGEHQAGAEHKPQDQSRETDVLGKSKVYWDRFAGWVEANDKFLVAFGTVILAMFTVVLGLATAGLWWATRNLVKGAEQTAERQLRAYVHQDWITIKGIHYPSRSSIEWRIMTSWKNFGSTPTRDFKSRVNFQVIDEAEIADFKFPDLDDGYSFAGLIAPNQSVSVPPIDFPDAYLVEVANDPPVTDGNPNRAFLVWGWAEYRDVFKGTPRRRTEFGFRVRVEGDVVSYAGQNLIWFEPTQKHNRADEECA